MNKFLITAVLTIAWLGMSAQKHSNFQDYLEDYVNIDDFRHAFISTTVINIEKDSVVASWNSDKSLVPASSLKVITNFAALDILGDDYNYNTSLYHDGKIEIDGTLKGNLYIVGSGDPSLASSKIPGNISFDQLLKTWVTAIKDLGISCIDGDVIADESIFDSFPVCPSWQWNDLGNYYASGAWGINVRDNQYNITYHQMATEGLVPKFKSSYPRIPGLELQHEINTGPKGSGDEAYIFGGPYDFTKRVVGTIPPGTGDFTIKGSIPDPPKFLAYQFSRALARAKIKTQDYRVLFKRKKKKSPKKIMSSQSVPLSEMIRVANYQSNNLITEAMLKTIGFETHQSGRAGHGIFEIRKWLTKMDIDISGLHLEDGSGLSVRNRVTSKIMAQLMQRLVRDKGIDHVTEYLPRVGAQGTVRAMLQNSSARGKIWAKSGSMNSIISYTGILKAKSGQSYSFSIIVNGFDKKYKEIRPRLEQYLTALYRLN